MLNEKTNNEGNITSVEQIERNAEFPIVDFNSYVDICNYNNDSSRRRGILSPEMYADIIGDPTTGFINYGESCIPVLIDIKHGLAMGYDTEKCRKYAEDLSENIKILALPFHELNSDERMQVVELLKSSGETAIYFSDHNNDESRALSDALDKVGMYYQEKPLTDPSASTGDEQAALYLYACEVEQNNPEKRDKRVTLKEAVEYYKEHIGPQVSVNGEVITALILGSEITDEQVEKIWEVYKSIFEELGKKNHPISMEDSREDFLALLRTENTMLSIVFSKDQKNDYTEPACFAFFVDDLNKPGWLNTRYLQEKNNSKNNTMIFTPGIVSSAQGISYSSLPIGLFAKAGCESGMNATIYYENTNVSKKYIPKIVDRCISRSCVDSNYTRSELLDQTKYRLLSIK